MSEYSVRNAEGETINATFLCTFNIPDLDKEYVIYSINDDNPESKLGAILLGEVVRKGDDVQVLGIKKDEQELVVAYYNELKSQIGGNING